jgi:hypothetical protein
METEIKGRDVLKIKAISKANNYNVEQDHKLFGQTYNLYQFNGVAFTVNSNDEFVQWKDNSKLYSATFNVGSRDVEINGQLTAVKTLQLTSCTSVDQEISMAQTEKTLQDIFKDEPAERVDATLLSQLA